MAEDDIHPPPLLLTYSAPGTVPAHWTNVSAHRCDPARFWPTYLKSLGVSLVMRMARLSVMVVALWLFQPFKGAPGIDHLVLVALGIILGVSVLITGILIYLRTRTLFATLEIVVSDQGILRRGGAMPAVEFTRSEITRIKASTTGLLIFAGKPRQIALLNLLLGYADLVARLKEWGEIPWTSMGLYRRWGIIVLGLVLGCFSAAAALIIYWSNALPLAIIALAYLVCVSAWAMWVTARNANLTPFRKTTALISLGFGVAFLTLVFVVRFAFPH